MRVRSVLVLALAIILGGTSVLLAKNWVKNAQLANPLEEAAPRSTVVVARVPLHFGNRLAAENLKVVEWPSDSLPEGAFSRVEDLLSESEERVVLRSIEPNEPVLPTKVSGFGGRATLSSVIDQNMRAVTIRVNDVLGVAGFVLPGDRVDIMITRETAKNRPATDILLQNVTVLGVDQQASDSTDKPMVARAVTLQVTAHQAQKLTLASTVGTLSLALRNQIYTAAEQQKTVTLDDLMVSEANAQDKAPVQAVRQVVRRDNGVAVRVVRGMAATDQKVIPERTASAPRPVPLRRNSPQVSEIVQSSQLPQPLVPMSW